MKLDYLIYLAQRGSSDIHPGGESATHALLHALNLRPHDRVLEIGCGTGSTMLRVLQQNAVMVVGIEFLSQMLAVTKSRLQFAGKPEQARLLQSNAARLPFPEQSFDRVFSESVLGFQEVDVVVKMLQEIRYVLKPGGLYVANEAIWKPQLDMQLVAEINRSCEADFGLRQSTDQAWDIAQWLDAAQAAGFGVRSADLLEIHLKTKENGEVRIAAPSWRFTRDYRLRRLLNPRSILQDIRYRRLLNKHREDGRYLEERLFVFEKP